MGWNYRVLRHKNEKEETFSIHEVYYDDENNPTSCSINPVELGIGENIKELEWELDAIREALGKPILDYDIFLDDSKVNE